MASKAHTGSDNEGHRRRSARDNVRGAQGKSFDESGDTTSRWGTSDDTGDELQWSNASKGTGIREQDVGIESDSHCDDG
jgi:hypothetical protein